MRTIKDIWIFAEQSDGILAGSYYEILTKAVSLFEGKEEKPCITAVVLSAGEGTALEELCASGADRVVEVVHEKLADYHPDYYTAALTQLLQERQPQVFLTPASPVGSEVAPAVAVRLDTGLIAHCTDLFINEQGQLIAMIPAFGGKLLGEIYIPDREPVMASVTPGVFRTETIPAAAKVQHEVYRPALLDEINSGIELTGKVVSKEQEVSLASADAVVCVGLGIRSQDNWDKAVKFAQKLHAAFGYTRPVVDMGYVDSERAMVGSSGKVIRPKLYVGFGISGAAQHVCGMKDSGLIISVNIDETADIFDVSNYKVVDDAGRILDELLRQMDGPVQAG